MHAFVMISLYSTESPFFFQPPQHIYYTLRSIPSFLSVKKKKKKKKARILPPPPSKEKNPKKRPCLISSPFICLRYTIQLLSSILFPVSWSLLMLGLPNFCCCMRHKLLMNNETKRKWRVAFIIFNSFSFLPNKLITRSSVNHEGRTTGKESHAARLKKKIQLRSLLAYSIFSWVTQS